MLIIHQLEINFLWPLNEQIELDLDYTNCAQHIPA
jgi:hypothetical protein